MEGKGADAHLSQQQHSSAVDHADMDMGVYVASLCNHIVLLHLLVTSHATACSDIDIELSIYEMRQQVREACHVIHAFAIVV